MDKIPTYTTYHWCIVPMCQNTSVKTPEKTFIQVPRQEKRRKLWLSMVRRNPKEFSKVSAVFVCEDHFDLENDMENYLRWKMMGGPKLLKQEAFPHKFECQKKRKVTFCESIPRKGVEKRRKLQDLQSALNEPSCSVDLTVESMKNLTSDSAGAIDMPQETELGESKTKEIGVTAKPHYCSKYTQTFSNVKSQSSSPFACSSKSVATSPFFQNKENKINIFKRKIFTTSESEESSSSIYIQQKETAQGTSSSEANIRKKIEQEDFLKLAYKHTSNLIDNNPKRYIGLVKECMYVVDLLEKYSKSDRKNIYITLQKIKLNQTYFELGDAYGISESSASRIFSANVVPISNFIKQLIIWPSDKKIKKQLPLPFRVRYSNVQCIIDCLEIEIQKPRDSVKQALTWSEYKKANTIKYLISSTPDGIVNFVSCGFGGRTSDAVIVEQCGFLDKLQPGAAVMADRGFKHIEHLIVQKKCTLIRPPSVSAGQKLNKSEVLETKRIASLRIHIERVIRRVREFKLLKPHSCVHMQLIPFIDHAIIIACGLINLQGPLIK